MLSNRSLFTTPDVGWVRSLTMSRHLNCLRIDANLSHRFISYLDRGNFKLQYDAFNAHISNGKLIFKARQQIENFSLFASFFCSFYLRSHELVIYSANTLHVHILRLSRRKLNWKKSMHALSLMDNWIGVKKSFSKMLC